jgi:uncharacterized membrane protein YtjA (UPF0391 family)
LTRIRALPHENCRPVRSGRHLLFLLELLETSGIVVASILQRRVTMLQYALLFLVIAVVAGLLGFGGIAGAASGIAQVLFFVFLALLVVSVIAGLLRKA